MQLQARFSDDGVEYIELENPEVAKPLVNTITQFSFTNGATIMVEPGAVEAVGDGVRLPDGRTALKGSWNRAMEIEVPRDRQDRRLPWNDSKTNGSQYFR